MAFAINDEMLKNALAAYVKEEYGRYDFEGETKAEFSVDFKEKMDKIIKRRKIAWYRIFNTAVKRAACIIVSLVIIGVGITVGVAATLESDGYKIREHWDCTEVIFISDGDEPYVIKNFYCPSYIPSGYKLVDTKRDQKNYSVEYENAEGEVIRYRQSTLGGGTLYIYSSKETLEELEKGVFSNREGNYGYYWSDGKYTYSLHVFANTTKEEVLKIAENLKDMNFQGPF